MQFTTKFSLCTVRTFFFGFHYQPLWNNYPSFRHSICLIPLSNTVHFMRFKIIIISRKQICSSQVPKKLVWGLSKIILFWYSVFLQCYYIHDRYKPVEKINIICLIGHSFLHSRGNDSLVFLFNKLFEWFEFQTNDMEWKTCSSP